MVLAHIRLLQKIRLVSQVEMYKKELVGFVEKVTEQKLDIESERD